FLSLLSVRELDFTGGSKGIDLIQEVLSLEFSELICANVLLISMEPGTSEPPELSTAKAEKKQAQDKQQYQITATELRKEEWATREALVSPDTWPQLVPSSTKLDCIRSYFKHTMWRKPTSCSCCSRQKHGLDVQEYNVQGESQLYCGLQNLRYNVCYPTKPWGNEVFDFGDSLINGLMLNQAGVLSANQSAAAIMICKDCIGALNREKVPKYSLANDLYCGELPEEFRDMTHFEEMVCSIYRMSAQVFRLYKSNNEKNPQYMAGNTCAHDMNIISTADVLPRTPSDIQDMLVVVLVGAQKLDRETLKNMDTFRIRKTKVWRFLSWLSQNNPLYRNVKISTHHLLLYPDEGVLPGLSERIVFDHRTDSNHLQVQEAAVFEEPLSSEFFKLNSGELENGLIEKSGVFDIDNTDFVG
ncbi:hypothetical protein AAF712_016134, partial [Marasmius tenuissimus]